MAMGLCVCVRGCCVNKKSHNLRISTYLQITNMERTSSIRRKTMARQHKAEVMIAGEQLRYDGM